MIRERAGRKFESLCLLRRQIAHRRREQAHLRRVGRPARVAVKLPGEPVQRLAPVDAGFQLRLGQRRANRRQTPGRQPAGALELIDVGARQRERSPARRTSAGPARSGSRGAPSSPRRSRSARCTALGVSSKMSRPRAISELTITPLYQYTDHEPPIDHARRVDRAAIEERDLLRVRGIGPVEHRDAALIPRLHHHVAARDRDERAVVRDAVLVRASAAPASCSSSGRSSCRSIDREDRVGAPLLRVGRAALRLRRRRPTRRENSTFVPSLLNVAECQYEKFESATAAMRTGFAGSLMSSSRP